MLRPDPEMTKTTGSGSATLMFRMIERLAVKIDELQTKIDIGKDYLIKIMILVIVREAAKKYFLVAQPL